MSAELGPANFLETKVIKDIRNMRRIPKMPYKVLDAPGLTDDFYQVSLFLFLVLLVFSKSLYCTLIEVTSNMKIPIFLII